jgi:hypothetical protein
VLRPAKDPFYMRQSFDGRLHSQWLFLESALCLRPDVIEVTHGLATIAQGGRFGCREPRK